MTIKKDTPPYPSQGYGAATPTAPPFDGDVPLVMASYQNEPIVATVVDDSYCENPYVPPKVDILPGAALTTTTCPSGIGQSDIYFGRNRVKMECPFCHKNMKTRVQSEVDLCTIIAAIIIFMIFCPLACVPFCCSCCKRQVHLCSKCGKIVGYDDPCKRLFVH